MKILVCDDVSESGLHALRSIPDASVDVKTKQSEDQLVDIVSDYDAIVVRSATKITDRICEAATELKAVVRAGMGYDNIDVEAATRRGILVMNTPGKNSVTTAEHTVAMMMALARNIGQAYASTRDGKWEKKKFTGIELSGKCLGLVGLGNVGREVARRAVGLNMRVIGHDPFIAETVAKEAGIELCSLEELFASSDVISLHAVLNDSTRNLINQDSVKKMKTGVRIINCARGALIDESALLEALDSGKVAGAALDVFHTEPLPEEHPFRTHEKVLLTPHLGASTGEAQEGVALAAADQLRMYFVDGIIVNGVNVASVSREVLQALGKYVDLAERMGSFAAQMGCSTMDEIHVECSGEIAKYDIAPLCISVLVGIMKVLFADTVNYVNAATVAKERGIRVKQSKVLGAGNFTSLIKITIGEGKKQTIVGGSVFGHEHERLVRYNHFFVEVAPYGHMLVIHNEDRPGVVGSWGTLLGKNQINISQMQVALDESEQEALSIVNIDTPISEDVLKELQGVDGIREVRQIRI